MNSSQRRFDSLRCSPILVHLLTYRDSTRIWKPLLVKQRYENVVMVVSHLCVVKCIEYNDRGSNCLLQNARKNLHMHLISHHRGRGAVLHLHRLFIIERMQVSLRLALFVSTLICIRIYVMGLLICSCLAHFKVGHRRYVITVWMAECQGGGFIWKGA